MKACINKATSILFENDKLSTSYKLGVRQLASHKAKCAAMRRRERLRRKNGEYDVTDAMSDAWASAPDFCAIRKRVDALIIKNGGRA